MAGRVFLYPGQGSQALGMGVALAGAFSGAADIFRRASALAGYDLLALCAEGPAEKLSRTLYTQPALFTVEAALTDELGKRGVKPSAAAGHSLGEFAAWYAAGAYDFDTGFALVSERARLMDGADPEGKGTMAAVIGLDEDTVRGICDSAGGIVVLANLNSPVQMVISGERDAVERAVAMAKEHGAKRAITLPVSGAFHSPLMESAREAFALAVEKADISDIGVPVYANVTASPVRRAADIRRLMVLQLTSSVRWIETVKNLAADGYSSGYEIGPGNVLAGLVKRIMETFDMRPVSEPAQVMEAENETA